MHRIIHWLSVALTALFLGGCADTGFIDEESPVESVEQPLLRFTSLSEEVYNPSMSAWRIVGSGISITDQSPFLDALSNGCDGTTSYVYSADPTSTKFLPLGFDTDLSPLPTLCRFTEVYWDACLRLKNIRNLDTATITVNGSIGRAAKKSAYRGTPRTAVSIADTRTFGDLMDMGVNTSTFKRIPLQQFNFWNILDCNEDGSACTRIGENTSLSTYEVWKKPASDVSAVITASDMNNQVQISNFRIRVRCDE